MHDCHILMFYMFDLAPSTSTCQLKWVFSVKSQSSVIGLEVMESSRNTSNYRYVYYCIMFNLARISSRRELVNDC